MRIRLAEHEVVTGFPPAITHSRETPVRLEDVDHHAAATEAGARKIVLLIRSVSG